MTDIVRPGTVEWTGDNPFIYLKQDPEGDWSALALFFRITASPLGHGQMTLVVEAPYEERADGLRRVCLTDNEPLARMLLDDFVARFPLFRPAQGALGNISPQGAARFISDSDGVSWCVERAEAEGTSIELRWDRLGPPFAVDVPPSSSATGAHEMLSVFLPASSGTIIVDGEVLPGATIERDFLNGRAQSAAMALSETWITPG